MGAEIGILRAEARRIVAAGLAASAAGEAVLRTLLTGPVAAPGPGGRRFIFAAGRFAREMALAARGHLGPCETLIVTDPVAAGLREVVNGDATLVDGGNVVNCGGCARERC